MSREIKQRIAKYAILLFGVVLSLWIARELFEQEAFVIDNVVWQFVRSIRSDALTGFFRLMTQAADALTLGLVSLSAFIWIKNRRLALMVPLNLVLALLLNLSLKSLVQRARPTEDRLVDALGYSFPSGHAMIAMAFYGLVAYLLWHLYRDRPWVKLIAILVMLLIPFIGLSRIYLGVHYTTDVLVGFLISLSYLMVLTELMKLIFPEELKDDETI